MPTSTDLRTLLVLAALALALVTGGLLLGVTRGEEVVRKLPVEARTQIFRDNSTEVRSTCRQSYAEQGPLRDHCVEQARFILLFPECGPECRAAANAILPHARR
jgi:hypothetical protein